MLPLSLVKAGFGALLPSGTTKLVPVLVSSWQFHTRVRSLTWFIGCQKGGPLGLGLGGGFLTSFVRMFVSSQLEESFVLFWLFPELETTMLRRAFLDAFAQHTRGPHGPGSDWRLIAQSIKDSPKPILKGLISSTWKGPADTALRGDMSFPKIVEAGKIQIQDTQFFNPEHTRNPYRSLSRVGGPQALNYWKLY